MSMNLARISSEYVSRPYKLGEMDCFMVVVRHLQELGYAIPDEFEGVTLETYPALFEEDPDISKMVMLRFMDSMLPRVHPQFTRPGDVLLLGLEEKRFLGIVGGNSLVISAVPGLGVRPYPVQYYSKHRGWRCQPQFQQ